MALDSKKHEPFFSTTGSGADKITAEKLVNIKNYWDQEKSEGCSKYVDDPVMAPILYQLQKMQDEIDYLRTEISTNKDAKNTLALGTTSTTALRGDTTTITTSQSSAITANTAKITFPVTTAANNALSFSINGNKLTITNTVTQLGRPGQPTPKPQILTTTLNLK